LVGDVVRAQPEVIADELIPLRTVLESGSTDEFLDRLAFRIIDDLSFKGYDGILKYMEKTLSVSLAIDESVTRGARAAVGMRNILIHNGGRVNEKFVRDTGMKGFKLGDRIHITQDHAFKAYDDVLEAAIAIDDAFIERFGTRKTDDETRNT